MNIKYLSLIPFRRRLMFGDYSRDSSSELSIKKACSTIVRTIAIVLIASVDGVGGKSNRRTSALSLHT